MKSLNQQYEEERREQERLKMKEFGLTEEEYHRQREWLWRNLPWYNKALYFLWPMFDPDWLEFVHAKDYPETRQLAQYLGTRVGGTSY